MTDHAFDEAWNAMLVRIPEERTELLKVLSNRYNLYMLSNTSELHVKVFEKMYLALDDYNHEVDEGLHITSMGGTWMSVIYGFGGMMVREGLLSFEPHLPANWETLSFKILYRGRTLKVHIDRERVTIENLTGEGVDLFLAGSGVHLEKSGSVVAEL